MLSDFNLGNETSVISNIVNLREIVSVTVARLAWNLQDLSAMYKAKCDADGGCLGLDVALDSGQHLVVSERALPLNALPSLLDAPTAGVLGPIVPPPPFVSVRRPVSDELSALKVGRIGEYIGDVLMPHSIRNKTQSALPLDYRATACVRYRLATVLNNHVYMESTLQPTYTAAAMFLLQSGVVRDVLNQSTTNHRVLAFNGNTQNVQVYVYIPQLNVIVSLVGCVLLVAVIAWVVLWPHGPSDPLMRVTDPHAIANVLANEKAFPPLLLSRFVVPSDDLDNFRIQSLALHRTTDQEASPPCTTSDSGSTPMGN